MWSPPSRRSLAFGRARPWRLHTIQFQHSCGRRAHLSRLRFGARRPISARLRAVSISAVGDVIGDITQPPTGTGASANPLDDAITNYSIRACP